MSRSAARIAAISTDERLSGLEALDASGLTLAPGFIDLHRHGQNAENYRHAALDGVTAVTAVAGTGEVTVASTAPLDEEAVRAAVDEAGYELVGTA